jgi:ABC-type phosphate transport system substrate-binding protein
MTTTAEPGPRRAAVLLALVAVLGLGAGCGDEAPRTTVAAPAPREGRGMVGEGLTGSLRVHVPAALAPVAERTASAFMRRYPNVRLTLVPSTAREGVVALTRLGGGAVLLDRPLNEEERRAFASNEMAVSEVLVGTDALAFVVPAGSAVRGLDAAALRRLLRGERVPWADLADSTAGPAPAGSAALALAPLNTGAVELLTAALLPADSLPRPAYAARDEQDALAWVARTPNGLAAVPMAALRADTTARVRAVAYPDSTGRLTPPSQRAVATGRYPLRQPVYLVVVAGRGVLGSAFATFARGTLGQEAVLRAGLAPAVMPAREIILD